MRIARDILFLFFNDAKPLVANKVLVHGVSRAMTLCAACKRATYKLKVIEAETGIFSKHRLMITTSTG